MTTATTCASRWFATIAQHYGTLDQFDDQRTIRIMLQGVIASGEDLDHGTKIYAVDPDTLASWLSHTTAQRHLLHIQQHALEQRLAQFS